MLLPLKLQKVLATRCTLTLIRSHSKFLMIQKQTRMREKEAEVLSRETSSQVNETSSIKEINTWITNVSVQHNYSSLFLGEVEQLLTKVIFELSKSVVGLNKPIPFLKIAQINFHHNKRSSVTSDKLISKDKADIALIPKPWTVNGNILGLRCREYMWYYDSTMILSGIMVLYRYYDKTCFRPRAQFLSAQG